MGLFVDKDQIMKMNIYPVAMKWTWSSDFVFNIYTLG